MLLDDPVLLFRRADGSVSFTEPPLQDQFSMIAATGVFDFIDRLPLPGQGDSFRALSQAHNLPMLTGSRVYALGPDYRRHCAPI